jgi:hypothetical protein
MPSTGFHHDSFPKNQLSGSDSGEKAACEVQQEYFVDADVAAEFLSLSRKRAVWRFRISELEKWIIGQGAETCNNGSVGSRKGRA